MMTGFVAMAFSHVILAQDYLTLKEPPRDSELHDLWEDLVPKYGGAPGPNMSFSLSDYSEEQLRRLYERFRAASKGVARQAVPPSVHDAIASDLDQYGHVTNSTLKKIAALHVEYNNNFGKRPYAVPSNCDSAAIALLNFLSELLINDTDKGTNKYRSLYWDNGAELDKDEMDKFDVIMKGYDQHCLLTASNYIGIGRDRFGVLMYEYLDDKGNTVNIGPFCTVFRLYKTVVLTAKHCVGNKLDDGDRKRLYVALLSDPGERHRVVRVLRGKRPSENIGLDGFGDFDDFAILELDKSSSSLRKPSEGVSFGCIENHCSDLRERFGKRTSDLIVDVLYDHGDKITIVGAHRLVYSWKRISPTAGAWTGMLRSSKHSCRVLPFLNPDMKSGHHIAVEIKGACFEYGCQTDRAMSGAPIIHTKTGKVIGQHTGVVDDDRGSICGHPVYGGLGNLGIAFHKIIVKDMTQTGP